MTENQPKKGRPTRYKAIYAKQATKLCLLGATDAELADFFEVAVSTIYLWKIKSRPFAEACKIGKEKADERVEHALFSRALGYSHDDKKVFNNGGEPLIVDTVKHHPPDTIAAIFWLKNRKPDQWRNNPEAIPPEVDDEIEGVTVEIVDASKSSSQ